MKVIFISIFAFCVFERYIKKNKESQIFLKCHKKLKKYVSPEGCIIPNDGLPRSFWPTDGIEEQPHQLRGAGVNLIRHYTQNS